MIQLTLYKFGKPNNSTAIPGADTVKWETTGQLKNNTSVLNPVILLKGGEDIAQYNYVYLPNFSRYYHVTDCAWVSGLWELSCSVDVLGSFRSEILASNQYVLRSASHSNVMIPDNMYPVVTNSTIAHTERELTMSNSGCFVIGCIGKGNSEASGVSYYVLNPSQMASLTDYLFTDTLYDGLTDTLKYSFNPMQYIVSCKWFPYDKMTTGGNSSTVQFGWWNSGIGCKKAAAWYDIDGGRIGKIVSIDLPKHPGGGYFYGNGFTKYNLLLPGAGEIALDCDLLTASNTLQIGAYIDPVTGIITYCLYYGADTNTFVQGQIGVDVQLSQVLSNPLGVIESGANVAGRFLLGDILGGIGAIGSAVESAMPSVSRMGTNGNRTIAEYQNKIEIRAEFYTQAEKSPSKYGSPLCANRVLSTLTGFTQCGNPQISIPTATSTETDDILTTLESGVIIA